MSELKEKIKRTFKDTPKLYIYLGTGILCVLLLMFLKSTPSKSDSEQKEEPTLPSAPTISDYKESLENELSDILSKIQGAGEVTVMVTLEGTEEKIFAEDTAESDTKKETETVISGSKDAVLKSVKNPKVSGVLIVCTGGDKPQIVEKVVNAASTVLDIPTSKVYVTKSK